MYNPLEYEVPDVTKLFNVTYILPCQVDKLEDNYFLEMRKNKSNTDYHVKTIEHGNVLQYLKDLIFLRK